MAYESCRTDPHPHRGGPDLTVLNDDRVASGLVRLKMFLHCEYLTLTGSLSLIITGVEVMIGP